MRNDKDTMTKNRIEKVSCTYDFPSFFHYVSRLKEICTCHCNIIVLVRRLIYQVAILLRNIGRIVPEQNKEWHKSFCRKDFLLFGLAEWKRKSYLCQIENGIEWLYLF